MKTKLDAAWHKHCRLRTEANKLWAEANKLHAEGGKLRAEGHKLWRAAITEVCGKGATVEWIDTGCIVAGVMEFIYEN
jgi:hypothetical protein